MRSVRVLVVVLAFLLAACGGSSGGSEDDEGKATTGGSSASSGTGQDETDTSSEGSGGPDEGGATASPVPASALVEKPACRTQFGKVEQVLTAMQDGGLKRTEYAGQVAQLKALEKQAKASCSAQVDRALVKALTRFEKASAAWNGCAKKCPMNTIAEDVYAGQDLAYEAVEAANRTK